MSNRLGLRNLLQNILAQEDKKILVYQSIKATRIKLDPSARSSYSIPT